ncbi:MAG: signal peptidase II [Anaerolineaceae bacterium]|nr:signal peptidase II [Anaerolineaceae bacterium]MBN2676717.1 signal peptidase II [Anaerolineaceae bacterium]
MKSYKKKMILNYALLATVALLVIGLDQWTKYLVRTRLAYGSMWSPWDWLAPYARIVHWDNSGAAFGMLQGFGGVFTILAIMVAIGIIYYYPRLDPDDWPMRLILGMQLGGALGNVVDRITREGRVTDFISLGTFPVFNVADSSITVGTILLISLIWYRDILERKAAERLQSEQATAKVGEKE